MSLRNKSSKSVSATKPMDSAPLPEPEKTEPEAEPAEETATAHPEMMTEPREPVKLETRTPVSKRLEKVRERMDRRRNEVKGANNTVRR